MTYTPSCNEIKELKFLDNGDSGAIRYLWDEVFIQLDKFGNFELSIQDEDCPRDIMSVNIYPKDKEHLEQIISAFRK